MAIARGALGFFAFEGVLGSDVKVDAASSAIDEASRGKASAMISEDGGVDRHVLAMFDEDGGVARHTEGFVGDAHGVWAGISYVRVFTSTTVVVVVVVTLVIRVAAG